MQSNLADRMEAATAPDRDLFSEAWKTLVVAPYLASNLASNTVPLRITCREFNTLLDANAWTSAAEKFIPKGWEVKTLAQQSNGKWWCSLLLPTLGDEQGNILRVSHETSGWGTCNMGLALAAAAVRAHAYEESVRIKHDRNGSRDCADQ